MTGATRSVRTFPVVVEELADTGLGTYAGIQDSMSDLDSHLVLCLRSLTTKELVFEPELRPEPAEIPAAGFRVRIVKAYVQRVMETKSAVVVLELSGPRGTSHFRAQTTALNWSSARGEFFRAVRKALDAAFKDLALRLVVEAGEFPEPPPVADY